MTTITINERTKAGKALLELATILSATTKAVTIDTNGLSKPAVLKSKTAKVIINRPNKTTLSAMKDAESGNVFRSKSKTDLMNFLNN